MKTARPEILCGVAVIPVTAAVDSAGYIAESRVFHRGVRVRRTAQRTVVTISVTEIFRRSLRVGEELFLEKNSANIVVIRPVASGRHQRGQKKYKRGRNFWKQILTDIRIVTQNSGKRVCFFAKKRRNSVKSNAAVRGKF